MSDTPNPANPATPAERAAAARDRINAELAQQEKNEALKASVARDRWYFEHGEQPPEFEEGFDPDVEGFEEERTIFDDPPPFEEPKPNGPTESAEAFARRLEREQHTNGHARSHKIRFPLRHFRDIMLETTAPYLIRDIIPRKGLVLLWGPPKCGKTFFVLDLAMHIALGRSYRGKRVKQGAVVYCSFEGGMGINRRVVAFRQEYVDAGQDVPFWLMSTTIALAKDCKALIADIRQQVGDVVPASIVLDTLNRSLTGSESSDEDMAVYIQAADAIAEAFGCAVIIIHHSGVVGERPRGHTSLTGAVDSQIACKKEGDVSQIEVEFMKDGESGLVLQFNLKQVDVGVDDDGETLTSCVIMPVEGRDQPRARPKVKLTGTARIALDALTEALVEHGRLPDIPGGIPDHTKVVSTKQWRQFAYGRGISASITGEEEATRKNREKAFARAFEQLVAAKLVGVMGTNVWRV